MTQFRHTRLFCMAGVAMLLAATANFLLADPKPGAEGKKEPAPTPTPAATPKIGDKAPEFILKDTDGKEHKLSELTKQGKIVVLEWFNPGCPFSKLHHEKQTTMNDLQKDFKDKNVVIFAVNSTNSSHRDFGKDAEMKKKWKMEYSILLDADGKVGHLYGAKTTPHMFVIDKKGTLAYMGAMDNDVRMEKTGKEKINYVRNALNELIADKKVEKPETTSYGCSVKY